MPTDVIVDPPRPSPGSQFVRFLVVGVGNTVLSFIAYRLLLAVGTPYPVAALLAFAVGALNGYIFNRRWTSPPVTRHGRASSTSASRCSGPSRRACSSSCSCADSASRTASPIWLPSRR